LVAAKAAHVLNAIRRGWSRVFERKTAALHGTGAVVSVPDRRAQGMTRTQQLFIEWNAERLGISLEESRRRYAASRAALRGGHAGRAFRKFNETAHEIARVFYDDRAAEIYDTYRYHAPMHFLAMLAYPEPEWHESDLIVRELLGRRRVSLLDFGCGLAQQSRSLAEYLRDNGVEVRLTLVDFPTLRREFLVWWGQRTGIATTFLACTPDTPIPELPDCDLCQATEFFEHVHQPLVYFDRIDAKLAPGGLLLTAIADHHSGFMHVSPDLRALRERVAALGYEPLVPNRVLRKPSGRAAASGAAASGAVRAQ
jgi:SAM-dependent methyltransferase